MVTDPGGHDPQPAARTEAKQHPAPGRNGRDQRHPGLAARVALRAIRGYQLVLSPWLGRQCRFVPTCSQYTREAIERFGALRGGWLGLRRVLRCQPLCKGGVDFVPEQFSWRRSRSG